MSKHRRNVPLAVHADVQNDARCTCAASMWTCPRHNADTYADQQARHATDSIGGSSLWADPVAREAFAVQTPEERYHSGNGWGR